ncbi:MAG: peptidase U32 family protein [Coriobacteriia bacterium]|nr:peptidase U32 family protein [Coriobacteriia bacterium]
MAELRKPELLAPAGGMEQLAYAIHFGADAVYLACDKYGLRTRASNFSLEELPRAVAYAHDHGVKVHVTCNIYAHDKDLVDLPAYARAIRDAGVDAVIVSDLGVLATIRAHAPELEVHVSTQASISNAAAALAWYQLGARRVVCAREMSLSEIADLKRELPADMQLEVFVHGAMCMAISGRCLISDHLVGRAANQGNCVQPCRWRYELVEESRPDERFSIEEDAQGTYIMNSKDLNMLAHLDALAAAGVDSIKIEGRVKKAFYVATVVNAYRHVLDGDPAERWASELEKISHRPYSTGFYFGDAEQTDDADTYVQLNDWVGEVRACEALDNQRYRVIVRCRNRFREGEVLELLSPDAPVEKVEIRELAELFEKQGASQDAQALAVARASAHPDKGGAPKAAASADSFDSPQARKLSPIDELPCERLADYDQVPVDMANKGMHLYAITTEFALRPRDILRSTRLDPSRKN